MSNLASDQIYTLQDVPGKGKGLVAIQKISKGTRILSEEPIITMSDNEMIIKKLQISIKQQFATLSEHQQRAFLSMHNIHPYKDAAERYLGIFRTNSLPAETDGDKGAIFLEACRINHACDNNAQKNWNENIKRHTVHALRDIDKGKEITITYLSPLKNRTARQKALRERFGFACLCHLCSLPPEQNQKSDRKLEEIHRLDGVINQLGTEGILVSPLRTLSYFDQQARLYNEQGREDVGFAQTLVKAAQLAIANSDLVRGRIFAEKAASVWKVALGGDSTQAIEYETLARGPSKYELYGVSMKWKTKVNEAPQGLEPNDFEDWLWRREKPKQSGQPVDFRNRTTFPSFNNLPHEKRVDLEFYARVDESVHRPRRHWLFLAEIVDFHTMVRLEMTLQDVIGVTLPLIFYTEGRGSELEPSLVQIGYTVAILYAQFRPFGFSKPGIRFEEPTRIKIFPLSLDNLLALSDRVQRFSVEMNGKRICHGCAKLSASLKKCAKCSLFWYCNGACQSTGWNEQGHKADCKLLKDPDLKGLFFLDWDKYNGAVQFPLNPAKM